MDAIVPEGFTTIRQAVFVLAVAIFAGIENSDAIKEFRAAGLDSQFDHAEVTASVKILWSEVDAGRIVISVYHPRTGERHRIDPGLLKDIPFLRSARFVGLDYLRPSHPLGRRLLEIFRSSRAATWSSYFDQCSYW